MSRRIKWIAVVICLVMLFQNTAVLHTTAAEDTIRTLRSGRVTVTGEFPKGASLSASRLPNPFKTPYSALAFYDIKAKHGKDTLHPESPVTVTVTGLNIPDGKDIQVIHVLDDAEVIRKAVAAGTASVTDDPEYVRAFPNEARAAFDASGVRNVVYVEYLTSSDGTVTIVDNRTVSFETASFSVFIITDTTFEKSVAASDGNTYEITAKYDVRAEIPRDAALQVSEIAVGSEEYNYYVEQTSEKIGCTVEELTYIRLFDIKLYGTESGKYYQPNAPVTVSIRLADRERIDEPIVRVIHFGEEIEQLKSAVDGNVVTFTTNGFSVYTLTPDQHRHTYRFYVPTGEEQTEFEEYHIYTDTGSTTFTQVIKDHSELVMPQLPSIENSPTSTFAGWYEGTESGGTVTLNSEPFDFANLPEITSDREIRLYARFGKFAYVIFHEQYNGNTNSWPIAATRRGEIANGSSTTTVRIDDVTVAYDDSSSHQNLQPGETPPPPAMAFRGWTLGTSINPTTYEIPDNAPLAGTPTTVTVGTPPVEQTWRYLTIDTQTDLYPVFSHINWLTPVSGPTGSGATYFAPTYYYSDEGLTNLNEYIPTRKGYVFAGWYTEKDADGNGTGIQITDASGNIATTDSRLTGTGLRIVNNKLMLEQNVTIYARWTPGPAQYTIVIWRQRVTDDKNAADSEKTYDFAENIVIDSTSESIATVANTYKTRSGVEYTGFHYAKCDDDKIVAGSGTTLLNVYYDRDLRSVVFNATTGNTFAGAGTAYIHATDNNGTQYGYINGEYKQITYTDFYSADGGQTQYTGTVYYVTTGNDGTQYGVVNGSVVQLTNSTYPSFDGTTPYTGQRYNTTTSNNTTPQYGVVNGELVQITRVQSRFAYQNVPYTGTRYLTTTSNTGTQYGFSNGEMVQLTRTNGTWYLNGTLYTGTRYTVTTSTNNNNTYYGVVNGAVVQLSRGNSDTAYSGWFNGSNVYTGTRYVQNNGGTYGFDTTSGQMREVQTVTQWSYNGNEYTGTRYTTNTNYASSTNSMYGVVSGSLVPLTNLSGWYTVDGNTLYTGVRYKTVSNALAWVGLYGQTLAQAGYSWDSVNAYSWNEQSNGNGTTQTLLDSFNNTNAVYNLYCRGASGSASIYHYRQLLDGSYTEDNKITAHGNNGTFNFSNKFTGFEVVSYSSNTEGFRASGGHHNTSTGNSTSYSDTLHVYHRRKSYTLSYLDSYDNQNAFSTNSQKTVLYEEPLASYYPTEIPVSDREGYEFSGWYADPACSRQVFFSQEDYDNSDLSADRKVLYETMPAANMAIYAGWSTQWYLIKIDPNGGEYPAGSNYSTWFWKQFGTTELISEYENTSRDFVESVNGTWYYAVKDRDYYGLTDEWESREDDISERTAYYTQDISDPAIVDLDRKFKQAEDAYRYANWFEVLYDDQGNEIGEQLYNFTSRIDHNITLRLHWKHVGTYNIRYDPGIGELDGNDSNEVTFHLLDEADYADKSDIVVTRTAIAPEGYNFVGWTIRGDDSGTIYYPGLAMEFQSRFAVKEVVNGETHEYLILDAVYSVAKTAKIIYDANGGTIDSDTVDYGHPSDPNPPAYETDCTDTQATISHLVNNSGIVLSDGKGFSYEEVGAVIVGWNTEPDGTGIHFDLGAGSNPNNPHYVDAEEPLTLYAEWEVKVYFHKNNSNAGSTLGGTWDPDIYTFDDVTYERALECYYTTVLLGKPVDLPPYTPTDPSTQNSDPEDDIVFHFWTNARYVYPAHTDEVYDFSQPVNGELHLYAYWDTPITVPIHVVDSTSGLVLMDNDPEHDWLLTDAIQVISGTDTATANSSDADNFISVKPANPGEDSYLFAFACISDGEEHISEDKIITSIYYNNATRTAWVNYANGTTGQLPDDHEIYFVYFRYPRTVNILYKVMDTTGDLSDPANLENVPPRVTSASIGEYDMSADTAQPPVSDPLSWATNADNRAYPFYSFAIGNSDPDTGDGTAIDSSGLRYISGASNNDNPRPQLQVRNFWNGYRYSTDGGNNWTPVGKDIALYVIYYDSETKPIIVTINEITRGLEEDLLEEFDYTVTITETTATYTRTDQYTRIHTLIETTTSSFFGGSTTNTEESWGNYEQTSTGNTTVSDTATTTVNTHTVDLHNDESDSETIFYTVSQETNNGFTETGQGSSTTNTTGGGWGSNTTTTTTTTPHYYETTVTQTVTTQTITITQTPKSGFVTTTDQSSNTPEYVYTYTTAADSTDQSVTYTNTRTPFKIEVHVAVAKNGEIILHDTDMRSSDSEDYTLTLDLEEEIKNLSGTSPINPFAGDTNAYTFAGIIYGTNEEGGTIVTPAGDVTSVAYQTVPPGTYYDLFFNGNTSALIGGSASVNSDNSSSLEGGYQLYYVYYELPKIYYVRETAAGTLVQYDPVQRNGAPVTLNGQTVAQGNVVPVSESGTVISQSVSGGYRVPPDLDGSGVLSSDYLKIGVGDRNVTNVSGLTATNDRKLLYIKVIDGQLKWSFDNSSWNNFTSTAAGEPTIYVIYRDDQDNRLVIVREDGAAEQDFWYTVTGPGGIEIEVCIPAGRDRVTITGVPYGNYTAVEHADWSWRYDTETSKTTTVYGPEDVIPTGALIGDSTIYFSGPKNNQNWLSGIDREENQYGDND